VIGHVTVSPARVAPLAAPLAALSAELDSAVAQLLRRADQ
jgi:hypothetical protein